MSKPDTPRTRAPKPVPIKFKKPTKPCHWCGRQTTSVARACGNCLIIDRRAAHDLAEPSPQHELTGGAWVPNRRGVLVWQPMDVAS